MSPETAALGRAYASHRVAVLYAVGVAIALLCVGMLALAFQLNFVDTRGGIFGFRPHAYKALIALHGVLGMFAFAGILFPCVFGLSILPRAFGATDFPFPRLNLLGLLAYGAALTILLSELVLGGPTTDWLLTVPESTLAATSPVPIQTAILLMAICYLATAINTVALFVSRHGKERTHPRWPAFARSLHVSALAQLVGAPVLAVTVTCALADRAYDTAFFDPARGADPSRYGELMVFAVQLCIGAAVVPILGVLTEVLSTSCAVSVRHSRVGLAYALLTILLVVGSLPHPAGGASTAFQLARMFAVALATVPLAIMLHEWFRILATGRMIVTPALAFALTGIATIPTVVGTGLCLGILGPLSHLAGSSFVIGHSHVLFSGLLLLAALAALHHWWMPPSPPTFHVILSAISALLLWLGIHLTFLPHLVLGDLGRPLRFSVTIPGMEVFHLTAIDGSGMLVLGLVVALADAGVQALASLHRARLESALDLGAPATTTSR